MKPLYSRLLCLFLCAALLFAFVGCSPQKRYTFNDVERFARYEEWVLDGPDLYAIFVDYYVDGTIIFSSKPYLEDFGEPYPEDARKTSREQASYLQYQLVDAGFYKLREDVSTASADGATYKITIYTDRGEFTSSGLNPINKRFLEIKDLLKPTQEDRELIRQSFYAYVAAHRRNDPA